MAAMTLKRRLAFAAITVVILLASTELILRIFNFSFYFNFGADLLGMPLVDLHKIRRIHNRSVDFDPHLFWKFKPDQKLSAKGAYLKPVTINHHGFRGKDFEDAKPADVYRIACLGDSSTFGWSVGDLETYPLQLGSVLSKKCGKARVEVMNLGVTGYTSRQGRELMARCVKNWKPDLVIFAFGPNDRLPAMKSDLEHLQSGTWDIGAVRVFLNRFQVYKLIKAGVIYLENRTHGLSLDPKTYIPKLKRKVNPEEFKDNVESVKKLCDDLGAGLILINVEYPSLPRDPASVELAKIAAQNNAEMPGDWPPWNADRVFDSLHESLGVPVLDLYGLFETKLMEIRKGALDPARAEAMRKAGEDRFRQEPWRRLMVDNGHPNGWGHEIIAAELDKIIEGMPAFEKHCRGTGGP